MTFFEENPIILLAGLGILTFWLLIITLKLLSLKRSLKRVNEAARNGELAALINTFSDDLKVYSRRLDDLEQAGQRTALKLSAAIQRVGLVRFDAFGDIGGGLSFALALLNEAGDGLVITTINGRTESRSYAKAVKAASKAVHSLSSEEEEAINRAMLAKGTAKGEGAEVKSQDEEL